MFKGEYCEMNGILKYLKYHWSNLLMRNIGAYHDCVYCFCKGGTLIF